jgi:2-polyprenyl-3-methyl-5-hydroxy-6-metoxy-1,4-benzoquinol methylase
MSTQSDPNLKNHWHWIRRWDLRAQESIDWACAQFSREVRQRGLARGYYEYLWNTDEILRTIPAGLSGLKIMDVGCGAGVLSLAMSHLGADVTAVDRFSEYTDESDNQMGSEGEIVPRLERAGIVVKQCDVAQTGLPGAPGSFDVVTCFAMIEHLHESPASFLAEMHRMLKVGGYLVITTPNHAWLRNRLRLLLGKSIHFPLQVWWKTPFYGHVREYTSPELLTMIRWAGFEIRHNATSNWVHLASRMKSSPETGERWTTRFTLDSPDRWLVALSLLASSMFESMSYSMLAIGQKTGVVGAPKR